jgi:hypothetical protein
MKMPPVHKCGPLQKWFVEIGVEELDCPAQILDPIEHLWDELKCLL